MSERKNRNGLLIVFTGKGKGKTTAALGTLMRAHGGNMKVIMLQFIKSRKVGEHQAAEEMGIEIIPLGGGFTWESKDLAKDRQLALECWTKCVDVLLNSDYDLVILDELTYPLKFGWLSSEEVLGVLRRRPKWMHVIITGRDAPHQLIQAADLVTEMVEVKHPLKSGIRAQKGIEF